jgi:hypothetical protein
MFFITDRNPGNNPVNLDLCTTFSKGHYEDAESYLITFEFSAPESYAEIDWNFESKADRDCVYHNILSMVEEHRQAQGCG